MKNTFLLFISLFGFASFAQTEFNKLDENGDKHGLWKGVYEVSQRPRYEGTFNHGKEIGVFKYYDDTKAQSVLATREFNPKDNSAYTIFFNQNSNKVSEGKVVNKLHEGEWKYFHESSKIIMTLENYKKGKLEGIKKIYFPNGKIAEETGYKNGIKEGVYKKYTETGIVLEDALYKNGQFHGQAVYKDPEGKVVAKGLYKDGKKVGVWEFYENGKLTGKDNFNKPRKKFQKTTVVKPEEY
ncbi:toxin-antitoxin system YwqK family antitoxin [Flavobacterium sp. GT3R68]|uniref:toxin-antitoxin system YwqK family antitoxin n=1 Tax=Flavobacterium sp. GT3R68 TaxID=2594437 RepID=UPI000F865B3E|nr:toxin-antitoxin system YwqK family antitoxin [Flavobacterium sp. GT3R68]RTY95329.1 toxin-antitoxin system YwqK family antitoxin [Flavobacterium sp. GSN2]TRW90931.1 toxin-antitoxin system YwqK family antitoxin [Flavobacterium sp. GT3R68]